MGTTPQGRGRYPSYDVLENAGHWDDATRRVVLERVDQVPSLRFFGPEEARVLGAFCDCVMAQDGDPRIPVLNMVDAKLFEGRLDGFQHAGMPDDRDVWRVLARALDRLGFAELSPDGQRELCERLAGGELELAPGVDCSTTWGVVMRHVLQAFYSHPWAWNEIGFGGPAYPRGYSRLGVGHREPWEGHEE